jgi:predicted GTPase
VQRTDKAQRADKVPVANVIDLANELAEHYEISSTRALIQSLTALSADNALNIAAVGRFKAGKSSFLNHFLGQN